MSVLKELSEMTWRIKLFVTFRWQTNSPYSMQLIGKTICHFQASPNVKTVLAPILLRYSLYPVQYKKGSMLIRLNYVHLHNIMLTWVSQKIYSEEKGLAFVESASESTCMLPPVYVCLYVVKENVPRDACRVHRGADHVTTAPY